MKPASWAVSIAVVAATSVVLAGCDNKPAATTTVATAPVPLAPPPPTLAAQHETAVVQAGGELKSDGLYVTIPDESFQGKKNDEFVPTDQEVLHRLAGLLKERDELKAGIAGYTDSRGRQKSNEALSLKRAEAVRDYLVREERVDAGRLQVEGLGPENPVASNDTEDGRAKNRRVVIRVTNHAGTYQSRAAMGVGADAAPPASP